MNRPLTDRERCLHLEARVAELEEELAAWRGNARDAGRDQQSLEREARLQQLLRGTGCHSTGCSSRLLLGLMARPGRPISYGVLSGLVAKDEDVTPHIVNVAVCHARKALRSWGLPGRIENIWGKGYAMTPDLAAALAAKLEAAA